MIEERDSFLASEQIALYDRLIEQGFRPIPADKETRRALVKWKKYQNQKPERDEMIRVIRRHPDCIFLCLTGKDPGIFALDVDSSEAMEYLKTLGDLGKPVIVKTAKGYHYIYKYPTEVLAGKKLRNSVDLLRNVVGKRMKIIDIRGDGGDVVSVGSKHHEQDLTYEYEVSPAENGGFHDAPEWLIEWMLRLQELNQTIKQEKKMVGDVQDSPRMQQYKKEINQQLDRLEQSVEGGRNIALFSVAAECEKTARRLSIDDPALDEKLTTIALGRGMELREIQDTLNSAKLTIQETAETGSDLWPKLREQFGGFGSIIGRLLTEVNTLVSPNKCSLTDSGNADVLRHLFWHLLLYDHKSKAWYYRDGEMWTKDTSEIVKILARIVIQVREHFANRLDDEKFKKNIAKWCSRSLNDERLNAMLRTAQALMALDRVASDWTEAPFLLPSISGIIDLKTGGDRPAERTELFRSGIRLKLDTTAEAPIWENCIQQWFHGEAEMIAYLEDCVGYTMTGSIDEQVAFFLLGSGANGKGICTDTIASVLGPFATSTSASTFERGYGKAHPTYFAGLDKMRMIIIDEISEYTTFDFDLLKKFIGGSEVIAKRNYEDPRVFAPQGKLWLIGNSLPYLSQTDYGTWRRIIVLPFDRQFKQGERDLNLKEQLRNEQAGILAWAIRCAKNYLAHRATMPSLYDRRPETVIAATEQFRSGTDPLDAFLEDCCEIDPDGKVSATDLNVRYSRWVDEAKPEKNLVLNRQQQSREFAKRFSKKRESGGMFYCGLRLR